MAKTKDSLEALQRKWREILKDSGFKDIEDARGNLKYPDTRTIAYENRDLILEFFLKLDHFMSHYDGMPKFERKIMEMYSGGERIKEIVRVTRVSTRHVHNVITRYKLIVSALQDMDTNEPRAQFPLSLDPQSSSDLKVKRGKRFNRDQET